ncbi:transglycosylase SLT domain-containing protein [Actinophytocola sp.]|uniref:transglycosylase SLT domain-containing protein n=1 Tax=Actinophytocola sp. TaxID=1872138 RepID=UPI002D7EC3AF|nr:transglycosylase SLT domain-containing protein [Actinophytocola sp.]HET9138513.1 transglycosylase SLT domain-containing protein [Actinophytocola sp.]HEU5111587.1 transglycosylase SLT domain-containing protein [Micromonosporaceae bacterium]
MGRLRRAAVLAGALSVVALGGWLLRWGAARAHTMGVAGLTPQTPSRDPARLAAEVRAHAEAAGVNEVLLMAILYNESYKPHGALLERVWQLLHRDSAFGVANMHRRTYERTRSGRPFAGRGWTELPDDPELAVQAAAWHLHDLHARLPHPTSTSFTRDELLAMGYNAGARNMLRFARGRQPGPQARAYLDRLREHWQQARRAVREAGG